MKNSFLLFAGWLIDGTGERAKENMILRVENGLIRSLRPARQADMYAPGLIDFSRSTIVPAMVDCHVHLSMSGTIDTEERRRQLSFTYDEAERVIRENLSDHLRHGIMAVRDGGDYGAHSLRFKREVLKGSGLPIHVLSPGKAWRSRGRYGRMIGRPPADGAALAEAIRLKNTQTDHIKIINSGINSLKQFGKETLPQFTQEQLTAAVLVARRHGWQTMVHANGREPVKSALQAGCGSIEHGFFMGGENLRSMAERQVFWVPTAYSMKAYARLLDRGSLEADVSNRNLDHQLAQIAHARQLEVPIAVGTDSGGMGIDHGKALVEEMRLLMEAGYSMEGSIRAATLDAARLLGLQDELGEIKKGMPASFLVAQGEPSRLPDALCPPEKVYIRGEIWNGGPCCPPLGESCG